MSYTYEYPRPAVSVDCVVVRITDSGREILLIRRGGEPFRNCWALPGGFIELDESLEESARRELLEETGLTVDRLVQIQAFGAVNRDPRTRVISIAWLATVSGPQSVRAGDDAAQVAWFSVNRLPELAFDHAEIIAAGLKRLDESG